MTSSSGVAPDDLPVREPDHRQGHRDQYDLLLMMVLTPFAAWTFAASGGLAVRFSIYALIQAIALISWCG